MRWVIYHRTSAADAGASVDVGLRQLREHVAAAGGEVVAEYSDSIRRHDVARPGWHALVQRLSTPAPTEAERVDGVAIVSLARLFPGALQLHRELDRWLGAGIHLASLEDIIDTSTSAADRTAWGAVLRALARFESQRAAEARAVAAVLHRMAALGEPLPSPGRPLLAVNRLQLKTLYEAGKSQREMVSIIKRAGQRMSAGTLVKHLRLMREDGSLDEAARERALARRGGLRRGGRPPGSKTKRPRRRKKKPPVRWHSTIAPAAAGQSAAGAGNGRGDQAGRSAAAASASSGMSPRRYS